MRLRGRAIARASRVRKHTWVQIVVWCAALLLAMMPDTGAQTRGGYSPPPSPPPSQRQPYTPPASRSPSGSQQPGLGGSSSSSGAVQMKPKAPIYPGSAAGQRSAAGSGTARALPPTIRQDSPVAGMKGYTGQVTATGKPVVAFQGKTYQIPQSGVSTSLKAKLDASHMQAAEARNRRWDAEKKRKNADAIAALARMSAKGSFGAAASPSTGSGSGGLPPQGPPSPPGSGSGGPPQVKRDFNRAAAPPPKDSPKRPSQADYPCSRASGDRLSAGRSPQRKAAAAEEASRAETMTRLRLPLS